MRALEEGTVMVGTVMMVAAGGCVAVFLGVAVGSSSLLWPFSLRCLPWLS